MCELYTNLMMPPGFQIDLNQTDAFGILQPIIAQTRFFAARGVNDL